MPQPLSGQIVRCIAAEFAEQTWTHYGKQSFPSLAEQDDGTYVPFRDDWALRAALASQSPELSTKINRYDRYH